MNPTQPHPCIKQTVDLPILGGNVIAKLSSFDNLSDGREHIALRLGPMSDAVPLVRLHSECLTGDVFGSQRCDCGQQLTEALYRLNASGGILLYLRQEGRGIGLYSKIDAYALQAAGMDTYAANRALNFADDERDYRCAAEMLQAMGVSAIRLLSNNPDKARQLTALGITVVERLPTGVYANQHNHPYLQAKRVYTDHQLELGADPGFDA
ncbi:GTP cyclohydrolase II [Chitinivorax tropicus]|uniref:GTP cyclohydrolase-2 n=1 Tax=Chitinivorax tropicus TaxID=714531 RepID=A0A840MQE5_9PROT|nr:GTP cyclohydrolase II [Chitinivorax tropicus]MBB5018992.1 GTP cyclohydrolase II [Chitinivorax tropicus]